MSPHGSAGSLAYSQLKFLPFLQLASITGPWGMTFVLLLFPAAIAIALHIRQHSWKRALQVAGAGVGVVAAVLLFGALRLSLPQKQINDKCRSLTSAAPKPNILVEQATFPYSFRFPELSQFS
jgi:apolipoprotein N-acyltransferase